MNGCQRPSVITQFAETAKFIAIHEAQDRRLRRLFWGAMTFALAVSFGAGVWTGHGFT